MTLPWYLAKARYAVRQYESHPLFEDLLSEAWLAAWDVVQRHPEADRDRHGGLVYRAAQKAAAEFLRSGRNLYRTRTRYGQVQPEWVPLVELDQDSDYAWRAVEPDFVPPLIERLDWERECQKRLEARDRRLIGLLGEGYSLREAGEHLGVHWSRAGQLLVRVRRRLDPEGQQAPDRYLGVTPIKNRWRAQLHLRRVTLHLGTWDTAAEAALVVDAATIAYGLPRPLNLLPEECR